MEITNWETIYKTEIETKDEHNKHFTLEEFLSYSDSIKQFLRESYNTTSLLDTMRTKEGTFYMTVDPVKECGENACELVNEFLKK